MTDQQGAEAGSGSTGSDPVVAVQQWLIERGLTAREPVADAVEDRTVAAAPRTADDIDLSSGATDRTNGAPRDPERAARRGSRSGRGGRPDRPSRRPEAADGELQKPEETARGVVLRKLTGQARSRHELDQALKSKQVPEDVARDVLDRMEQIGLVDDAAFARTWVESRQQRRQLSRRALRYELQHKGVDRDQIEDALASVDGDDEYVAALALAERKIRGMAGLTREVRYRRLAGALARRGFSGEVVGRVIGEVLDAHQT